MAIRKTFEEILTAEFRWPNSVDAPFIESGKWETDAFLDKDPTARLAAMTYGYKLAADLMVERATRETRFRNFLVYPIIFNYRQFLELTLKSLISTFGANAGVNENWRTHDLVCLWSEFQKILDDFGTNDPDDAEPVVRWIVAEFSKIDPGSYSYRYPVDKNGNPLPLHNDYLDLKNLSDVMEAVANYFIGCEGYLSPP